MHGPRQASDQEDNTELGEAIGVDGGGRNDAERARRRLRVLGIARFAGSFGWLSGLIPLVYWNGLSFVPGALAGWFLGVGIALLPWGAIPRLLVLPTGTLPQPDPFLRDLGAAASTGRKPWLMLLAAAPSLGALLGLLAHDAGSLTTLDPFANAAAAVVVAGHVWSLATAVQALAEARRLGREER